MFINSDKASLEPDNIHILNELYTQALKMKKDISVSEINDLDKLFSDEINGIGKVIDKISKMLDIDINKL